MILALFLAQLCAANPRFFPESFADTPVRARVLPGEPSSWLQLGGPDDDEDDFARKKSPAEVMDEMKKDKGVLAVEDKKLAKQMKSFKTKLADEDKKALGEMDDHEEKFTEHLDHSLGKFKDSLEAGAEKFKEKGEAVESAFEKSMEGNGSSDDDDESFLQTPQSLLQYRELPGSVTIEEGEQDLDDLAEKFSHKEAGLRDFEQKTVEKEKTALSKEARWYKKDQAAVGQKAADFVDALSSASSDYKDKEESEAQEAKERTDSLVEEFKEGMKPSEAQDSLVQTDAKQLRKA